MYNNDDVRSAELVEKWKDLIEVEGLPKLNKKRAVSTAIMLENQERWLNEGGVAWNGGSMGGQPADTSTFSTDGIFYNIAVPMVRRTFPELIAHEIVGVQPMTGPAGVAFALRYKAGGPSSYTDTTSTLYPGTGRAANELGYNAIDANYSGSYVTSAGEALGSKAGSGVGNDIGLGIGAGTHMNEVGLTIEKKMVEAKTRKLRSRWSLEIQQDLKAMHGVDIETEMMDILGYEITQEIDRELIDAIRAIATASSWDFDASDTTTGRWEIEKYRALYNRAIREANKIAITTRRGAGNWIVASPTVCAALETLSNFIIAPVGSDINTAQTGVARVGSIDGRFMLYRDTFASSDSMLVGLKGKSEWDTGIIYLPYIQLMLSRAVFQDSLNPTIGLMSRYAIFSHIFGAANYYRNVTVSNMPE